MNFNPNRGTKASSPLQRSLTPTMLIESPKVTLANYKLMIKKSKEKPKTMHPEAFSIMSSLPSFPQMLDRNISTDTCIFSSPSKPDSADLEEIKAQLNDLQVFTKNALEAQKKYFEEIIFGLEEEIQEDRATFTREISALRDELLTLKVERDDLSAITQENGSNWDYRTQYFKNQEFISILERQNQLLHEKINRGG